MKVKLNNCDVCLSSDRHLVCLSKIQTIINELQLAQIFGNDSAVCWECHRNMVKFCKFLKQVKQTQELLSRNIEVQKLRSLSTLLKTTKINYDYEYTYYDPLINTNTEEFKLNVKEEPVPIKEEGNESTQFDVRINSDTDSDEKPLTVFADSFKIKNDSEDKRRLHTDKKSPKQDGKNIKEKSIKSKKIHLKKECIKKERNNSEEEVNKETDKEVLSNKFETILFTEEEMLKRREEKRNQANYKKIPFKCDSCVTGFTKKDKYEYHMKNRHEESLGAHSCSVCKTRFASKTSVCHHQTKHYVQYKCKLCSYKVSSAPAAVNHSRDKHADDEEDRIHCRQCAFVGRTSKELSEHMRTDHLFACAECGLKFKGRNTLRAHKTRIHSVKREFSCEVCTRTFMNKSRLECHMARHSDAIAKRLAYCAPCRTQYKDIHVYRNHLRNSMHHVQDRVTCPDCNKKFASRVYWSKHYKFYHLKQSRYKCHACDKLFISEWRLKIHKQTNHGLARTRDHACAVCGKEFYTKATLMSHSLLHASSRAFMCAQCGAAFRQRAALHTHHKLLHHTT